MWRCITECAILPTYSVQYIWLLCSCAIDLSLIYTYQFPLIRSSRQLFATKLAFFGHLWFFNNLRFLITCIRLIAQYSETLNYCNYDTPVHYRYRLLLTCIKCIILALQLLGLLTYLFDLSKHFNEHDCFVVLLVRLYLDECKGVS